MNQKKFLKHRARGKKAACLLVSLVLLLMVGIVGTAAYLIDHTETVVNTFEAAEIPPVVVENFDGTTKSEVKIMNNGNVDAYIRVSVVFTWRDANGNVYGEMPVENTTANPDGDYVITWSGLETNGGWIAGSDGFYYYVGSDDPKVAPLEQTSELFTKCEPVEGAAPDGYSLSVEILAQTIQADPDEAIIDSWGTTAAGYLGISTGTSN